MIWFLASVGTLLQIYYTCTFIKHVQEILDERGKWKLTTDFILIQSFVTSESNEP